MAGTAAYDQRAARVALRRSGRSVGVRRMTDGVPACPECSQAMESGGFALATREDDGRRICRTLLRCTDRHVRWRWADRPEEPLEACPTPELFR